MPRHHATTLLPSIPQAALKPMTARERGDLCQIVRQRERLAKTVAAQRSAPLRADFEKLQTIYSWDCDEVWSEMHKLAQEATQEVRTGP